jgi:hypothetical protein
MTPPALRATSPASLGRKMQAVLMLMRSADLQVRSES